MIKGSFISIIIEKDALYENMERRLCIQRPFPHNRPFSKNYEPLWNMDRTSWISLWSAWGPGL